MQQIRPPTQLLADQAGIDPPSSLSALIETLKELGFKNTLKVQAGELFCSESDEKFTPQRTAILGIYRFEGASDPQDLSVVYAVETDNGTRGVILDAFGPKASPEVGAFIDQTTDRRQASEIASALPTDRTVILSSAQKEGALNSPKPPQN
ncbi:MAG: hypothetical protein K1X83_08010 [Oligoflexia bacterium]|nr:hypothetical protein [Oligoflexia bacterium]